MDALTDWKDRLTRASQQRINRQLLKEKCLSETEEQPATVRKMDT